MLSASGWWRWLRCSSHQRERWKGPHPRGPSLCQGWFHWLRPEHGANWRRKESAPAKKGFACLQASLLPPRHRGRIRLGSAILGKFGKKRLTQIPTKVLRGRDAHISGRTLSSFLGKRHLFCNEKPCSVMLPEGKTVISGRINVFCIAWPVYPRSSHSILQCEPVFHEPQLFSPITGQAFAHEEHTGNSVRGFT